MRFHLSHFALAAVLTGVVAHRALACLCAHVETTRLVNDADLVVDGVAYETLGAANGRINSHSALRFRITDITKAPPGVEKSSSVTVLDASWCSAMLTLGTPIRLFAKHDRAHDRYFTSMCSGTRLIGRAHATRVRCEHPHSAKAALAIADVAFGATIIFAYADEVEHTKLYHYKVLVLKAWKGIEAGHVVTLDVPATGGLPVAHDYASFFARRVGATLLSDDCLRPEPAVIPRDYEERTRALSTIQDDLEKMVVSRIDHTFLAPPVEYAITPSGELNSRVFDGIGSMFEEVEKPDSKPATRTTRATAPQASQPTATSQRANVRPRAATPSNSARMACSRCSLGWHNGPVDSVALLSCLAALILLGRRKS